MRLIPSLPTLDPLLTLSFPRRQTHFPFDRPTRGFYLARAGVARAVRALGGGHVLMPAYHHGVEVEAVRAAGARVSFYRVDRRMRAELDDLRARLATGGIDIVYLTHFVGFAQDVAAIAQLCREHGARLIEDCALALLSRDPEGRPLGSSGDAAVFCLYKTLPVPHGGLLRMDAPAPDALLTPTLTSTLHHAAGLALAHAERAWPGGRWLRALLRGGAARVQVDIARTGTQHIAPGDLDRRASRLVAPIIARLDLDAVVRRRRENFIRLAEALAGDFDVIGAPLAPGVCPLFLPVRVADKPAVARELQAQGLDAIDFWSQSAEAEPAEVTALRREVLELPCHQSMTDEDLARVVTCFRASAWRRAVWPVARSSSTGTGKPSAA